MPMSRRKKTLLTIGLIMAFLFVVYFLVPVLLVLSPTVQARAKATMAMAQLATIQIGLQMYQTDHGRFPKGLDALVKSESPYLDPSRGDPLSDPWGKKFLYQLSPDGSATVSSLGADGVAGGTDANADIIVRVTTAPAH